MHLDYVVSYEEDEGFVDHPALDETEALSLARQFEREQRMGVTIEDPASGEIWSAAAFEAWR